MMDDNLSDVQQDKKMSVEEISFKYENCESNLAIKFENEELRFMEEDREFLALNRAEAHLLMLYLQQHLGYVSISKDRLDE